jgi:predicted RNase H-like nuclease (RuvC/YqgF family)
MQKLIKSVFAEATEEQISKIVNKFEQQQRQTVQLEQQLKEANKQIESFKSLDVDGIQKAADEWKTRYEQTAKESKANLKKLQYEFAVKSKADSLKFSSNSAKKAFLRDINEQNLSFDGENIMGFDDFVENYKANDPEAFKQSNDIKFSDAGFGVKVTNKPFETALDRLTAAEMEFEKRGINV